MCPEISVNKPNLLDGSSNYKSVYSIECDRTARFVSNKIGFKGDSVERTIDSSFISINVDEVQNYLFIDFTCPYCYDEIGIIIASKRGDIVPNNLIPDGQFELSNYFFAFPISEINENYQIPNPVYNTGKNLYLKMSPYSTHSIYKELDQRKRIIKEIIRDRKPRSIEKGSLAYDITLLNWIKSLNNKELLIKFLLGLNNNTYGNIVQILNFFKNNPTIEANDVINRFNGREGLSFLAKEGYISMTDLSFGFKKLLISYPGDSKIELAEKGANFLELAKDIEIKSFNKVTYKNSVKLNIEGYFRQCNRCNTKWYVSKENEDRLKKIVDLRVQSIERNNAEHEFINLIRCPQCQCWGYKEEIKLKELDPQ